MGREILARSAEWRYHAEGPVAQVARAHPRNQPTHASLTPPYKVHARGKSPTQFKVPSLFEWNNMQMK